MKLQNYLHFLRIILNEKGYRCVYISEDVRRHFIVSECTIVIADLA